MRFRPMRFRNELSNIKRLVVKVGSNVVSSEDGHCDLERMRALVRDIAALRRSGVQVLLVSSGAVNIGRRFLNPKLFLEHRVEAQQAASAIGQPILMQTYGRLFQEQNLVSSQILLTHEDFKSRQRYLNAKRTLETLLENDVAPVLNENDTVSFREITVGDNDALAAQAALLIEADALLLITSADGLCDRDPSSEGAKTIKEVGYGESLEAIDVSAKSLSGRGGMKSKLEAARKACGFGIHTIISSKQRARPALEPLSQEIGTYFHPRKIGGPKRKKLWLASLRESEAAIEVDRGAYRALCSQKSLLPVGVAGLSGDFSRGDCVNLICEGEIFGRGISFYSRRELELAKGKRSGELEKLFGSSKEKEAVHVDNLVLESDLD